MSLRGVWGLRGWYNSLHYLTNIALPRMLHGNVCREDAPDVSLLWLAP